MSRTAAHDDIEHVLALWRATLLLGFRGGPVHLTGPSPEPFLETRPRTASVVAAWTPSVRTHLGPCAVVGCTTCGETAAGSDLVDVVGGTPAPAIVALLAPSAVMDAPDGAYREAVDIHADLLGAVRLPLGTALGFGLRPSADVLLLLRRAAHEAAQPADWQTTTVITLAGRPVRINTYFDHHPDHLLGTATTTYLDGEPHAVARAAQDELGRSLSAAFGHIAWQARRTVALGRDRATRPRPIGTLPNPGHR